MEIIITTTIRIIKKVKTSSIEDSNSTNKINRNIKESNRKNNDKSKESNRKDNINILFNYKDNINKNSREDKKGDVK